MWLYSFPSGNSVWIFQPLHKTKNNVADTVHRSTFDNDESENPGTIRIY